MKKQAISGIPIALACLGIFLWFCRVTNPDHFESAIRRGWDVFLVSVVVVTLLYRSSILRILVPQCLAVLICAREAFVAGPVLYRFLQSVIVVALLTSIGVSIVSHGRHAKESAK